MLPKLQYISQGETAALQLRNIQNALEAGCRWIQLRFKNAQPEELKIIAEKAKALCAAYNAIFIVNDHPTLARAVNADGVHLGLNDMPVEEARAIVGSKIVGGTANTFDDVKQRYIDGCDYVGLGPFSFTTTKEKLSPILGLIGYAAVLEKMRQQGLTIPVYAIGGILPEHVDAIMQIGAHGIAVSGVITHAADSRQIVTQLINSLYATAYDSK
jgi:thiamine-phosphate pyrophosphorylase